MVEHHNSGGGGRYYKDEASRRSRKYYSSPHNYSTYSSYTSNPNPFPPSSNSPQAQQQQSQSQSSQSNPFSSRRNDGSNPSTNPEAQQPQTFNSPTSASSSPSSYSSRTQTTSTGNWYHTSQPKRTNTYRTNRPPISILSASGQSRRSVPGSYREDLMPQQTSRYADYNGYMESYQHDHYLNGPAHKKSGFSKSKYNGQFTNYPKGSNGSSIEYREFQSYRQNHNGSLSGKQSLMDSKTPVIGTNNYKTEKSSSQEPPRTDSEDHDISDVADVSEKYTESSIEKSTSFIANNEPQNEDQHKAVDKEDKTDALDEVDMDADNNEEKIAEIKVESISKVNDETVASMADKPATSSSDFDNGFDKKTLNDKERTPETSVKNIGTPESAMIDAEHTVKDVQPEAIEDVFPSEEKDTHSSAHSAIKNNDSQIDFFSSSGERNIGNTKAEDADRNQANYVRKADESSDDEHAKCEGCIFPMLENQYRAWELKHRPKSERRKNLKYLNRSKLKSLSQYNFLDKAFLIFKQADAFILFDMLKENAALIEDKKAKLTEHYVYSKFLWQKDVAFYYKQLEKAYESENDVTKKPKIEEQTSSKTTSSRRSRHHGDSVRTEAEFMEILASLEQERERDPLIRAQYGAAIIPDMILDPIEKYALTRKMDSNNLVRNKSAWAQRILTDPVDTFTDAEHAKFCDLYTLYPKKFGRISHDMGGLRSSEECVLHYYKTKKTTNYKQLVANKNKKSKKKSAKKKKDSKTKGDAATPDTSNVENDVSMDNSKSPDTTNIIGVQVQDTDLPKDEVIKRKLEDVEFPETKHRKLLETSNPLAPSSNENVLLDDSKPDQLSNGESEVKLEDQSNADISSTLSHVSYVNESLEDHPKVENVSDHVPLNIDESVGKNKKHKKKDEEKSHISSYWSVHDINNFPLLLEKFGSRWEDIAEELGTKSATMVKNYYQRGLVEHPDWQSFLAINRPSQNNVHPIDSNDYNALQTEQQRRPSMGYFYKPATSYATNYSNVHQILPVAQQPPVNILNDKDDISRLQHVPHFVPIGQTAPLYAPYVTDVNPIGPRPPIPSQGPMPVMPARNGIMNMSSLLNSGTGSLLQHTSPPPPPQQQSNLQLPPLNAHYPIQHIKPQFPPTIRGPSIMNLLNSEDAQPNNKFESITPDIRQPDCTTRTTPFKPNISNIMNSPGKMGIHDPDNSVSVYHHSRQSQPSQLPQQPQQLQQLQQPQGQRSQQGHESLSQSAFMGGTSALDALARIAFERK